MRSLLELEAFAPNSQQISDVAKFVKESQTITILAPATCEGAVACAILEAALLDQKIPYRRRFAPRQPTPPSFIIKDGDPSAVGVSISEDGIVVQPSFTTGARGMEGASHQGQLSPIASIAAIAELISPQGKLTRSLRPWLLVGNWWGSSLDQGYDPVYTVLRDHLCEEGTVRLVTLPEVSEPDLTGLSKLDLEKYSATKEAWGAMTMADKSTSLSSLVMPQIMASAPSTARLEELVWQRLLVPGESRDLHSIWVAARAMWDGSPKAAADLIDAVLTGKI